MLQVGCRQRTVEREVYQFVDLTAKMSARLKLHNVPALFRVVVDASYLLGLPGVPFFHQDMSFRSVKVTPSPIIKRSLEVARKPLAALPAMSTVPASQHVPRRVARR